MLLEVTGTIGKIDKDILTKQAYVLLKVDALGILGVQCMFPKKQEAKLEGLRPDQEITIRGKCDGKIINVILKQCELP